MRHSLTVIILFFSLGSFAIENFFNVVIDPGHGGSDSGAIHNKIKESELVLQISKQVLNLLREKYPDVKAQLTRVDNTYLALEDRIKNQTDQQSIDLFVSLHANSSVSAYVQGMEVYFQPDQKKKSESIVQTITNDLESTGKSKNSLYFAKNLQTAWNLSPSVIRRSSFFVVEKTDFPSVLVELGFLSNAKEAEKLKSATYQSSIAETIVKSIVEYKKMNQ